MAQLFPFHHNLPECALALSTVALLADHIHLTLGCLTDQSPKEVALSYLNNCAHTVGMKPIFQFGYYSGTIGEYDRGSVSL